MPDAEKEERIDALDLARLTDLIRKQARADAQLEGHMEYLFQKHDLPNGGEGGIREDGMIIRAIEPVAGAVAAPADSRTDWE